MTIYDYPAQDEPKKKGWLYTVRISALMSALIVGLLVVTLSSRGFFVDTTSNPDNSWATGNIELTDNDGGATAMFSASAINPGYSEEACIVVTYTGTVPASDLEVRLYGTSTGDLADDLGLTIEYGNAIADDFSGCDGFTAAGEVYDGSVSGFAATHSGWANGNNDDAWAPSTGTSRTYRFTVSFPDSGSDQSGLQNQTAGASFTWEARSTP